MSRFIYIPVNVYEPDEWVDSEKLCFKKLDEDDYPQRYLHAFDLKELKKKYGNMKGYYTFGGKDPFMFYGYTEN